MFSTDAAQLRGDSKDSGAKKISPQLESLNKSLKWWSLIIVFTHYFNFFAVWMNTFNCTKLGGVVGQWSFGTLIFHSSYYNEKKNLSKTTSLYPVQFIVVLQFLKWPSSRIPLFMLNISNFKLKTHLYEITYINWICYQRLSCIPLFFFYFFFFDRAKIVWRCQCVKQPNWNKVYIDDINNNRGHRDIQNFFNRCWRKKKHFHCTFIYEYWSVYWVYLSIILNLYWLWVSSLQFV